MLELFLSTESMVLPFFCPATLILWNCESERDEERSGGKVLRLIQIRLATSSLEKISPTCQHNSLQVQPPIRVPVTQSAFHLHAQQNAFRRRDARPLSRFLCLDNAHEVTAVLSFRLLSGLHPSNSSCTSAPIKRHQNRLRGTLRRDTEPDRSRASRIR
jgi:hypothetical protein